MMDIDAKIVNKILAIHISNTLKGSYTHPNEVGFIIGMQGFFNICKSINQIKSTTSTN